MDAREWNEYYADSDQAWTRPDDDVVDEVAGLPVGRALDLGAGEGANSIWLARRGWQVTAIDQAPAAIETLVRLAAAEGLAIRGEVADIAEYRPGARCDLSLICYVHLPPATRERTLANAAAALAPGGVLLLIGIPAPDRDDAGVGEMSSVTPRMPEPLSLLPEVPDEIGGSLRQLTIERCDVRRRTIGSVEGELHADVLLIRARRPVADNVKESSGMDRPTKQ